MFSSRYIKLTVAALLAASSVVFVIATFSIADVSAESKTSETILKSKILRRNNQGKVKLSGKELTDLRKHASPQEEREFEDEIPKHVPLKFKLKAEKEKKFKDLGNHGWYRDFELEVTNTSSKPIYYLEIWLVYPEIESGIGAPLGVPLRYGRMNFIYQQTLPLQTDVPIQAGETYVFTIPEKARIGWEEHKLAYKIPDPKKVVLKFVQLSFGDGTGFDGTDAKPYPYKKEKASFLPCREGPPIVAEGGPVNDRSIAFEGTVQDQSLLWITGRLSAGYFSAFNGSYSFLIDSSSPPDLCCGSGCYFMKPITESCNCGSSRGNSYPGCSDSKAACGIPVIIGTGGETWEETGEVEYGGCW